MQGQGGNWLLDSYNVTIANGALAGNVWTPSGSGSTISNTKIQTALNAGNSVTITTMGAGAEDGNITLNGAISYAPGSAPGTVPTLTLSADRGIVMNNAITSTTHPLNVTLSTNVNGGNVGEIRLNAAGTGFTTRNGTLTLNGNTVLGSNLTVNANSGNIAINGTVNADAVANARTLTLNSIGTTTIGAAVGAVQALASVTTNTGGTTSLKNVTTSGAQNYNDAVTLNGTYSTTANGGNGNFRAFNTATL